MDALFSAPDLDGAPPAAREPRRILQSLVLPEPPLPAVPDLALTDADERPRPRRGRPRKATLVTSPTSLPPAAPEPDVAEPVPEPASASPVKPAATVRLRGRKDAPSLRPGERWKRRLPRACW